MCTNYFQRERQMKIKFYGTRGSYPTEAQMSCAWVEAPDGNFVIDLGSSDLFKDRSRVAAIDHVLLTHFHPDHIAMLASLVLQRWNQHGRTEPCTFVAPESVQEYMVFSGLHEVPGYTQLETVPKTWCGLQLEATLTNHPKKNFAYKLSDETTTLVWTGDGSYSTQLVDFCRGADVIICESSMREENIDNAIAWGHMTPSLFSKLMNEAKPNLAIATHFTELEPADFSTHIKKRLNPDIELITAYDGLILDLT